MNPLTLYLDTSVIGGFFDAEFMTDTRTLWKFREQGRFRFITSQLVFQELVRAPGQVLALARATFTRGDVLMRTPEAEELARTYITRKVVPVSYEDDARHVAICSVAHIEYLVSWNFKHLANLRREAGFNAVNVLQGFPPIRIVAPTFLIYGYEEKDL